MAQEFGGHPDTAASRMRWVRQLAQTGELAKLHTALAYVAATAQAFDGREWVRVACP